MVYILVFVIIRFDLIAPGMENGGQTRSIRDSILLILLLSKVRLYSYRLLLLIHGWCVSHAACNLTTFGVHVISIKIKIHSSCEIEEFVETHLCKLFVILRQRVFQVVSATPLGTTV